METALIRTTIWEDEKIDELNSDTRLLYLALLTNPKRNTTKIFKCPDKLLVAYTGYDVKLINLCRNQLIEKKFINYIDGYYILNGDEFVEAKKGRFTKVKEKEYFSKLPIEILNLLKNKDNSSRVTLEYNNKYNNKDKDNNKDDKDFDIFWKEYPLKKGKGQAKKTWNKLKKEKVIPSLQILVDAIKIQKEEKNKQKQNNEFCPEWKHPSTWLNAWGWEDEVSIQKNYKQKVIDCNKK